MTLSHPFGRIAALGIVCAGLTAVMPAVAWAFRAGEFAVEPYVSVLERYDTNITSASSGALHDAISGLTTGVDVALDAPMQTLKAGVSATGNFYLDHDGFNNISQDARVSWSRELTKYDRLSVSENFRHAEDPATFADEFGQGVASRQAYYQNRAGIKFSKDVTSKIAVDLGYNNEIYNRTDSGATDSTLHALTFDLRQAITAKTFILGSYGFSHRSYTPGDYIQSHDVNAGVRQYLTAQVYADVMAGVGFIEPQNGSSRRAMQYSARLTNELDQTTRTFLSFDKSDTTSDYSTSIFRRWSLSGGYEHDFTQRLHGNTELFTGSGRYVDQGIKDRFTGFSLGVAYDLTRQSTVYLRNSFSSTDSNISTRDYVRNVTETGYKYRF